MNRIRKCNQTSFSRGILTRSACVLGSVFVVCAAAGVFGCGRKADPPAAPESPKGAQQELPKGAQEVRGAVESHVATVIKQLGGTVTEDPNSPNSPITKVSLRDRPVDDKGLEAVGTLTRLEELDLANCRGITDDGLARLKGLKGLRRLVLDHTPVTGAGLVHLHGLPIAELYLTGTPISDAGLKSLTGFKSLKLVRLFSTKFTDDRLAHLKGLSVEELILGANDITGPGVAALKDVNGLKVLGLSSTPISDAAVPHLKGLTGLTTLRLQATKMTDAGLQELQQALPNTKIVR